MSIRRMYAIVLRFLYYFRHSLDRAMDMFYWPVVDLVLWGLTSLYFTSLSPETPTVIFAIVAGILFWSVVYRGQYEISGNVLEDLWTRNLVNIFVSPLSFGEWLTSFFIVGIIKSVLTFSFAAFVAYLLYSMQVTFFGWYLVPFLILLIMNGWWIGCFMSGLLLRFGTRIQSFAWTFIWLFSPFMAIYFPVSVLPLWAQSIARVVPGSYVFEAAREYMAQGTIDHEGLYIAFGLNVFYLMLGIWFLERGFRTVLRRGLVKLQ